MNSHFSSQRLVAFNFFVALVLVVAADVASAQIGDALKGAAEECGAAKVGSGVAVE